jgi:hypothetical protein
MSYSQEPQPTREVQYTVTVDEETGAVTLSSQFSREEIDNRIQESSQETGDVEEETQEGAIPNQENLVVCHLPIRREKECKSVYRGRCGFWGVRSSVFWCEQKQMPRRLIWEIL